MIFLGYLKFDTKRRELFVRVEGCMEDIEFVPVWLLFFEVHFAQ